MRKVAVAVGVALLVTAALIGVEIALALSREYLPSSPVMRLGGTFGSDSGPPLKFVVLGDSTAAGLGAGSPSDAYPTVLARRLADEGRRVELVALGVSGARTHDVLMEQVPQAVEERPDLVFVGIGANDVTHATSLDSIRKDAAAIVERLRASGATVVVAGAPDMRALAFHEPLRSIAGWRGRSVAAAIEEAALAEGASIVKLAEETGRFFAANPEAAYSEDDFHPGPEGYGAWADAIYPVLRDALVEKDRHQASARGAGE